MAHRHLNLQLALCLTAFWVAVCETHQGNILMRRVVHLEPNAHLQKLAQISDTEGSLARTFFSPAHRRAAAQIQSWMADCGMQTWVDAVGNVHGRIRSAREGAPVVLLGSHYDTVLDGGAYDGALGILVGLAAVKGMLLTEMMQRNLTGRLPAQVGEQEGDVVIPPTLASSLLGVRGVHLVAFADEEGVRFGSTFLGSRAVAGTLLKYGMLSARDRSGLSLEEVLREEGGVADPRVTLAALALDPATVSEYVEVHMEQGPVLEAQGLPLGVVAGVAGQTRLWVHVNGTQGHAGTVPMRGRRDALAAAAELVVAMEELCTRPESVPGGVPESESLVCTVGELKVWPGASNVISGYTGFSVDVRSKHDPMRLDTVDLLLATVAEVCGRRGVQCNVDRKHDAAAMLSDPGVIGDMSMAVKLAEPILLSALTAAEVERSVEMLRGLQSVPVLVSGAGHDAMAIAETIPKMGMMFVRCRGGVSHSPLEHVEPHDVTASTAALAAYLWGRAVSGVLQGDPAEAPAAASPTADEMESVDGFLEEGTSEPMEEVEVEVGGAEVVAATGGAATDVVEGDGTEAGTGAETAPEGSKVRDEL